MVVELVATAAPSGARSVASEVKKGQKARYYRVQFVPPAYQFYLQNAVVYFRECE